MRFWKKVNVDEELDFYRQMREAEFQAAGMTDAEAREAARRAIGNVTQIKEEARAAWMFHWVDDLRQDVMYAVRSLRTAPAFALMAIGALGLGIGVNTSLFTFFNAFALRPWAIKDPGQVVAIYQADQRRNRVSHRGLQHPFFEYVRDHTTSMAGVTGTKNLGRLMMEQGGQRINVMSVATAGNYFDVMGVPLAIGRAYTQADDVPGIAEPSVVLSYAFWQAQFQGRSDVVGSEIMLNRAPARVVGVAAESFRGTTIDRAGLWMPLHAVKFVQPENTFIGTMDSCCTDILARLKPGVSRMEAQSEITVIGSQWLKQNNRVPYGMLITGSSFFSHPRVQERIGPILGLFSLAVGLVLVLACANVSNLLLARAASRRKEIAVRLSLGAGRWRIIRQLLTESLVLSLGSATVGFAIAFVLPKALFSGFTFASELSLQIEPDTTVLAFSIGLSLLATVVFGLMPALQATKLDLQGALKDHAAKLRRWDLRRGLAAAQVALCVIILTGAGLLLRGLLHASQADSGFNTARLAALHLDLRLFAYTDARALAMSIALREKLATLPGVEGVTYVDILPYGNNGNGMGFKPSAGRSELERVNVARVAVDYHRMMNIPLLAGRGFTQTDVGRPVAIINEVTARMGWGGEDPIGKRFNDREVIGVARNSVYRGLDSKLEATVFFPVEAGLDTNFLVRLKDPRQLALIRDAVRSVDPQIVPLVNRLDEDMDRSLQPSRMAAGIALGLGAFALTLACVGLYGVVAYNVAQRTREIGVRMALGARPREVTRLVLGQNLQAVFVGLIVGIGAAAFLSRLLANLLYGLSPLDPVAYAGVILCLLLAVLAASIVPARKAASVDPIAALRSE